MSALPRRSAVFLAILALGAAAAGPGAVGRAQEGRPSYGYAHNDPSFRFTAHGRPVKVVVLAGSIGAFRDHPYARLLHEWCTNAEIQNISSVGLGAPQLLRHFQSRVINNPNIPVGWRGHEMWLLFGGGLNSVGHPELTNHSVLQLITLAHRRRLSVVAMTLTPWGADPETDDRWRGAGGLHVLRSTFSVVDFVLGRSTPQQALGTFARSRGRGIGPNDPWQPAERPDVAINLYDPMRDPEAATSSVDAAMTDLRRDSRWQRATEGMSTDAVERQLREDASLLARIPQHTLRSEFRGFDHIHPNREGHRAMARIACPSLPESWGCNCP
ncbi:MAG: hypothetical protein AB7S26_21845 [Sandaracinaceae bacterium]